MFKPIFGPASIQFANGEEARNRRKMYDRAFAHDRVCSHYKTFQKVGFFDDSPFYFRFLLKLFSPPSILSNVTKISFIFKSS